jgi:hypothetical protein
MNSTAELRAATRKGRRERRAARRDNRRAPIDHTTIRRMPGESTFFISRRTN